MCHILQVPVPFFFDGAPQSGYSAKGAIAPSPAYVSDFLANSDGLKLVRAFTQIGDAKLRHCVVRLVEEIVGRRQLTLGRGIHVTNIAWYAGGRRLG